MESTRLSSKGQIVLPKGIRNARGWAPGTEFIVEEALAGTTRLGQQQLLQADVQKRAQESLRLAEIRYKAGADDLLTVLDAQRTLFAAQDQLAQIELNRLQAAISLYKALGGGWNITATPAPSA